jgi:hypothetical protein
LEPEFHAIRRLLEFLAKIKSDCTGLGSALVRTIEANTGLTREEIYRMALDAERDSLVKTIRLSLPEAEGLLAVMMTPKGRKWMKKSCSGKIGLVLS